jgi:hypothetical protein
MATRNTNRIIPLEASVIDATTLTGAYQQLYEGCEYAVYLFRITNTSDSCVEISFDKGITDHDISAAGTEIELGAHPSEHICWPEHTEIWVKGAAAQGGHIYLSAYTIKKDLER